MQMGKNGQDLKGVHVYTGHNLTFLYQSFKQLTGQDLFHKVAQRSLSSNHH